MNSTLIPFSEILENFKDDSGKSNVDNIHEKIRRWIFRAEQDLGYNGTQVYKKIKFLTGSANWSGKKLILPTDCLELRNIYIDECRVHNNDFRQYGNNVTFTIDHSTSTKIEVFYYGIMHDIEGNPAVPRIHAEAINSYLLWKSMAAKAFLDPGRRSRAVVRDYEQDWKDNRDASIGDQAFPQNDEDYEILSTIRNLSSKDAIIYFPYEEYEDESVMEVDTDCTDNSGGGGVVVPPTPDPVYVYVWQYDSFTTDISNAPNIDNAFLLSDTSKSSINVFKAGTVVSFTKIGRINFGIQKSTSKQFKIFDTFNNDITDSVFDHYYNATLELDIYTSKTFYSYSNIYFKFK